MGDLPDHTKRPLADLQAYASQIAYRTVELPDPAAGTAWGCVQGLLQAPHD